MPVDGQGGYKPPVKRKPDIREKLMHRASQRKRRLAARRKGKR